MARDLTGRALEIGSNPYFTTYLLKAFTGLDLALSNYFGPHFTDRSQTVFMPGPEGQREEFELPFEHFDIETQRFPYPDESFDVVLFCEVLEHMTNDPLTALREINRVLRPGGRLILTTPNVARLENICRLIAGANLYDPYSGYGPHGRHNREYIMHELYLLLKWCGFELEVQSTADVHENRSLNYVSAQTVATVRPLLDHRNPDLGQYLFTRSVKKNVPTPGRPTWLFLQLSGGGTRRTVSAKPRVRFCGATLRRRGKRRCQRAACACKSPGICRSVLDGGDPHHTCALDYVTWANHFPPGDEISGQVRIRRFPVAVQRETTSFDALSTRLLARQRYCTLAEQHEWMRAQGPVSPDLTAYIRERRDEYDAFIFFGYLYATTCDNLPLVADKAWLVPCTHLRVGRCTS